MIYFIGDKHPVYGEVIACGTKDGEAYRMFKDKQGCVSLIPLPVLELELKNKGVLS